MQKKTYPLYLVPCLLALCLALGFLMSCGDDTAAANNTTTSSGSGQGPVLPPVDPNLNVVISDLDTSFRGWTLLVKGRVYLTFEGTIQTQISKIVIQLSNSTVTRSITLGPDLGDDYSLVDGQDGFDFKDCAINKGQSKVYVDVYLSDNPNKVVQRDSIGPFERPYEECASNLVITTTVSPNGGGTITRSAEGPYSMNQQVTLTAVASNGFAFYNWTSDGLPESTDNPYTYTVRGNNKNLQANFVESLTLVKDNDASKDYRAGENIADAVTFTGGGFDALGGTTIAEHFKGSDYDAGKANQYNRPPQDQFSTSLFAPEDEDLRQVDYEAGSGNYFVAKKSGNGWGGRGWYLIMAKGEDLCTTGVTPKCTRVTVWKVQ